MPACQAVGLSGFQFKMLRTANATAMVALAVDIKTAQSRAGHRRASTTLDFYAQPTKRADRAAADALGSYFFHETDEPADAANGELQGGSPTLAPPRTSRDKRAMTLLSGAAWEPSKGVGSTAD